MLTIGDLLEETAQSVGPALDLQSVLAKVLEAMHGLVDFRGGSVSLVRGRYLRIAAASPEPSPEVLEMSLPVGSGLSGRVATTGVPLWSHDLDIDNRVDPEARTTGSNAGMRSYLAVPLFCLGEVIGVLQIDSEDPNAFEEDDLRLLRWLASQVAGAVESARRYQHVVELERLKSEFLRNVSHELRTPMTIIAGFLSLLRNRYNELDPGDRAQLLERSEVATDRLGRLIDSLLTFSRMEAGVLDSRTEPVRVRELLEKVADAHGGAPTVVVECEPDLVLGFDPVLMGQAISALVDNAVKYGGGATVRAEGRTITVADDGPGLPEGVIDSAFESFTRGHLAVAGMGVGLPMARSLVEVCGGHLNLETSPENGTTVTIELRPSNPSGAAGFELPSI
jgi:signal transduction histidine kinase